MPRRLIGLLFSVLITAVACGEAPPATPQTEASPPAGQPQLQASEVSIAANKVEEAGSFKTRSTMVMEIPEEQGGGELVVSGRGAMDVEQGLGKDTMSFSGTNAQASLLGKAPVEAVYDTRDSLIIYMKMPFLNEQIPGSKEWIKMDLQKAGEGMGIDLNSLMQSGQSGPTAGLDYMRGTKDVEEVGKEKVRGVQTTHYKAVADFDLLASASPEAADSISRLKELTGIEEAPVEVWVDEKGLARKLYMVMDYNPPPDAPAGTPAGRMSMSYLFYDFGTPVDVKLPPADQVFDPFSQTEGA